MDNNMNHSLINALNTSISRITCHFGEEWLVTGNGNSNGHKLFQDSMYLNNGFEMISGPENHNFTEICICLEGSLALQIDRCIHDVKEGDLCLILPGVLHNELPKAGCGYTAIWIAISLNGVSMHLSGKKSGGAFYTFDGFSIKNYFEASLLSEYLRQENTNRSPFYNEMLKSHIIQLLVTALRKVQESSDSRLGSETWKESVISQVKNYVKMYYNKNIRLAEVSQEICISANYLNTIFKSQTGKTIIQYAEAYKIEKAKDLLGSGDESVASVAFQLGYYDQYHFSKIFKKETGFTPSQFRKSKQVDYTSE